MEAAVVTCDPEPRVAVRVDGKRLVFGVLTLVGAVQVAIALPHPGSPSVPTLFGAACLVAGLGWLLRHRER